MKMTKKIAAVLFVCGIFQTAVFALDGGALLYNDTSYKTNKHNEYYLNQKDVVTAWMKVPFGNSNENYFICEGLYKYEFNQNLKKQFGYIDLNLFKAIYNLHLDNSDLKFEGGRFYIAGLSPIVYSQNADGFRFTYKNDIVKASAYVGYTGLLNGNIVKMVNAPDYTKLNVQHIYSLQDKYVVTAETFEFENLFANQMLSAEFIGAFRADSISDTRMYMTLLMKGPFTSNLIYNIDATAAFRKYDKLDMKTTALVRAVLGYFFDKGSVNATAIFASKNFASITSHPAIENFTEPEYSGLLKAGLAATYKPVEKLLISAGGDVVFDATKDFELKGALYNVSVTYQIFSDLSACVKWNQYFDINKSDFDYSCVSAVIKVAF